MTTGTAWELAYSQVFADYAMYADIATFVWWDIGTNERMTGEEVAAAIIANAVNRATILQINIYSFGTDGKRWLIELWYVPLIEPIVPAVWPIWAWLLIGAGGMTLIGGGLGSAIESVNVIVTMMPLMMMMIMMMIIPAMMKSVTPEKVEKGIEVVIAKVKEEAPRVAKAAITKVKGLKG